MCNIFLENEKKKKDLFLCHFCTELVLSGFVLYLYERGHGLGRELAALYLLPISLMSQNWTLTDSWRWINSPDSLIMVMRNGLKIYSQLSFSTKKNKNVENKKIDIG